MHYMSFHTHEIAATRSGTSSELSSNYLTCHCSNIRILPWNDAIVDANGFDPRSNYVETFWLSTLGPTVTWLIRFTAYLLDKHPQGMVIDPDDISLRIGIGTGTGRNSALMKAIRRCIRFELARLPQLIPSQCNDTASQHPSNHCTLTLEVRRKLPALPTGYLNKLPGEVRLLHSQFYTYTTRQH